MEMEEAIAGTAQGDLADVVTRAGAMAALPSRSHQRPPPSSPSMAGQIVMNPYEEDSRRLAVMFEAPSSSSAVDPYLSSMTAPRSGYWLPSQQLAAAQISQEAYLGRDVVMSGATADVDGDDAMRSSPAAAAHQMMKRKNDVKKVVCIPVPPATNSRPGGGEVIPSDLWAWRKYGQKPIKGSPYPRYVLDQHHGIKYNKTVAIFDEGQHQYSGYYRCSSSKGCMARKQVERSRCDPNMLVITYTAEHNHPWPMQRNVLAGYSRPHTHVSTNCKKKNNCRFDPTSSSLMPSSKNIDQNVVASGDLEYQQSTNMMESDAAAHRPYTVGALSSEGVLTPMPPICNGMQPADEVFAELEELESSNNLVNANTYSRGVGYEWNKF